MKTNMNDTAFRLEVRRFLNGEPWNEDAYQDYYKQLAKSNPKPIDEVRFRTLAKVVAQSMDLPF